MCTNVRGRFLTIVTKLLSSSISDSMIDIFAVCSSELSFSSGLAFASSRGLIILSCILIEEFLRLRNGILADRSSSSSVSDSSTRMFSSYFSGDVSLHLSLCSSGPSWRTSSCVKVLIAGCVLVFNISASVSKVHIVCRLRLVMGCFCTGEDGTSSRGGVNNTLLLGAFASGGRSGFDPTRVIPSPLRGTPLARLLLLAALPLNDPELALVKSFSSSTLASKLIDGSDGVRFTLFLLRVFFFSLLSVDA
mmetsp:Transcript_5780/g.8801  ORF Transcript_5780/g.8801 Transcript_5780/m.8801 type:complete len:249 (+) Transcript_5780:2592-3338(+)